MQTDIAPIFKSRMAMETSTSGKKKNGKIPKRIHKSEREKMKRESLNELFLALANSLELPDQNSGKASVLIEATRTVKDMLDQIECLKNEHTTLLSESQYVNMEAIELKDENSALEAEISKLQTEINSKTKVQLDLNMTPHEYHNEEGQLQITESPFVFPLMQHGLQGEHGLQGQIVSPSQLAAFCSNIQGYRESGIQELASKHSPVVSKPHARYLTPSDKWPSQVLEKQPELGNGDHQDHRSSN